MLPALTADDSEVLADPLGRLASLEQRQAIPLLQRAHLVGRLAEFVERRLGLWITELPEQLVGADRRGGRRKHRDELRDAVIPGVLVARDIEPVGAGTIDPRENVDEGPVGRPAPRCDMRDLQRDTTPLGDRESLVRRLDGMEIAVTGVEGEQTVAPRQGAAKEYQFIGRRPGPERVFEAGLQPEGARLHRAFEFRHHGPKLGGGAFPRRLAEDRRPDRVVPDETCLFCGKAAKPTREHVYPRWLARRFGVEDIEMTVTFNASEIRKYRRVDLQIKDACGPCNHGWMSRLEDAFKSSFGRMILGHPGTLDAETQRIGALWAVKLSLHVERSHVHLRGGGYAPLDNMRWLGDHSEPPPGSRVWITPYATPWERLCWVQTSVILRLGPDDAHARPKGYVAALTVGAVLFQVFARDLDSDLEVRWRDDSDVTLRQIWPVVDGVIDWPFDPILTTADLDRISPLAF